MKYLILHKSEWERLKRQYEPHKVPPKDNEYLRRLHELSQKWIRSWPDTVQGHVEVVNKGEATKKDKITAEIKKFALRRKKDISTPAILRARKLVFDDSCYGRQLISSLIQSKTLEERDAQIKFNKELKIKLAAREQEISAIEERYNLDLNNTEKEKMKKHKDKEFQIGMINKKISCKLSKLKELVKIDEKQKGIEDLLAMKQFIENDKKREDTSKCVRKQYIEYAKFKEEMDACRAKEREKEERINQVWLKYSDKVRGLEKITCEKIQRETPDASKKQHVYRMLEAIKEDENNKYNAFVEKGIRDHERILLREDMNVEAKYKETKKKSLVDNFKDTRDEKSFCSCDTSRQTLLCSSKKDKKTVAVNEMEPSGIFRDDGKRPDGLTLIPWERGKALVWDATCVDTLAASHLKGTSVRAGAASEAAEASKQSLQFLQPSKSLVEKLKIREKESSPYSGTKASHDQFAEEANKILQECHHKRMARKVIDEYKKVNCLNPKDLSITNQ